VECWSRRGFFNAVLQGQIIKVFLEKRAHSVDFNIVDGPIPIVDGLSQSPCNNHGSGSGRIVQRESDFFVGFIVLGGHPFEDGDGWSTVIRNRDGGFLIVFRAEGGVEDEVQRVGSEAGDIDGRSFKKAIKGTQFGGVTFVVPFIWIGDGDGSGAESEVGAFLIFCDLGPPFSFGKAPSDPFSDAGSGLIESGHAGIIDGPCRWWCFRPDGRPCDCGFIHVRSEG
jgi:hypothetical protein